jgi:hypothetical protein
MEVRALVTYAVIDAHTGTTISTHPSLDAARAGVSHATDRSGDVAIYVFDDTGFNGGECCEYSRSRVA